MSLKINRVDNNKSRSIKSQRLINALLSARKENPDISIRELEYVAYGFRESQRG